MSASGPVSLSDDPPQDLAIAESTRTASRVISDELRRLAEGLGRVPHVDLAEPARSGWVRFARVVSRLARSDRGAFLAALRGPSVSAPLRVWLASARGPGHDRLAMQIAASALAELATSGALEERVELPAIVDRFAAGARGSVSVPGRARTLSFARGEIAIDGRAAEVASDATPLSARVTLTTFDDNPLASIEAHPDKEGNTPSLGERSVDEWRDALLAALSIVERYLPSTRAEMELTLQRIVPVGFDAERHLSASYREAIGTIYVSLHPDPMTMAEALVHEHQHTKLNAALASDELLLDALEPRFASPVRPDLRPLLGVLLAVHAFVPLAELWSRMLDASDPRASTARGRARLTHIVRGNRDGLDVIVANAKRTRAGDALLEELLAHQARHEARGA